MIEKEIEKSVCDYATKVGVLNYKFSSPNHVGVPDRIFFPGAGEVFMIEFKKTGGKTTAMQEREAKRLNIRGVPVFLIDTVGDGRLLISFILNYGVSEARKGGASWRVL